MLNKFNFEIAKLASKNEDESLSFRSILVCSDKSVVTEGHMICELTGFEHSGDILPFDDVKPQSEFTPFLMPADEALALAKVFVKSESKDANLILIQPKCNEGEGTASFGLKQPHSEKVFRIESPGSEYPEYEKFFGVLAVELASVALNLDLLIPLLQQLKKISPAVRIGFYGEDKAVRLDCIDPDTKQSARAAIMPIKM